LRHADLGRDQRQLRRIRCHPLGRIQRELSAQREGSAKAICKRLWEAVAAHSAEKPHQDDFVTVVVKRQA